MNIIFCFSKKDFTDFPDILEYDLTDSILQKVFYSVVPRLDELVSLKITKGMGKQKKRTFYITGKVTSVTHSPQDPGVFIHLSKTFCQQSK